MKNTLIRSIALALCFIMLFALGSCTELGLGFDNDKTESIKGQSDHGSVNELPVSLEKKGGVYTVMLVNEGGTAGSLANLFICSFDTVDSGNVSFMQIPVKTYINNEFSSLAGCYMSTYNAAISDGDIEDRAREKAVAALETVIESHLCVYIDYYLCATPDQLGSVIEKLGGIEINIPYSIKLSTGETLTPGKQNVNGSQIEGLVKYNGFSDNALMNLYKTVISSVYTKAKSQISNDMVSLFVLEIRSSVQTNIPSDKGEDIFFMRKFITASSDSVRFTQLATQSCAVAAGIVEVMHKVRALELINGFLCTYAEELENDKFDTEGFFTDKNNQAVNTIYTASGSAETVYTAGSIENGALPLT